MMCFEEGILQTYLDGESDMDMAAKIAGHLAGCAACRERLHTLEELAGGIDAALAPYRQETEFMERTVRVPRRRGLPQRSDPLTKARRFVYMFQRYRLFAGAVASLFALTVFLSWGPGRGLAAQFLNIFRTERLHLVEISPEDMAQLAELLDGIGGRGGEADIPNFGRLKVEHPVDAAWVTEADLSRVEELSGLNLNLPAELAGRERTEIVIEQPPDITFAPNVEGLNNYLRTRGGMLFSPDLAGRYITICIPPLVRTRYGQLDHGFTIYAARDLTIEAPPGIDLASLRQALLGLPFLSENLRRQLAEMDDWQHTLPIPGVRGMSAGEVTVNGIQGVYFVDTSDDRGPVVLAWRQSDGWRAISGLPLEEALQVAAEVR